MSGEVRMSESLFHFRDYFCHSFLPTWAISNRPFMEIAFATHTGAQLVGYMLFDSDSLWSGEVN